MLKNLLDALENNRHAEFSALVDTNLQEIFDTLDAENRVIILACSDFLKCCNCESILNFWKNEALRTLKSAILKS